MMRVRIFEKALEDMASIDAYIEFYESPYVAARVASDLAKTFELLATFPQIGRMSEHFKEESRCYVGQGWARSFLIYFNSTEPHLQILRVVHGMRDQPAALDEDD